MSKITVADEEKEEVDNSILEKFFWIKSQHNSKLNRIRKPDGNRPK